MTHRGACGANMVFYRGILSANMIRHRGMISANMVRYEVFLSERTFLLCSHPTNTLCVILSGDRIGGDGSTRLYNNAVAAEPVRAIFACEYWDLIKEFPPDSFEDFLSLLYRDSPHTHKK